LVALALVSALILDGAAAAAEANAGGRSLTLRERRRQLLRQRQVRSHLKRLNKAPLATIQVLLRAAHPPTRPSPPTAPATASVRHPFPTMGFAFPRQRFRFLRVIVVGQWE
jgi:hypothetical protein